jgi:hypothetical protein
MHNMFKTFSYLYIDHTGTPCRKCASARLNSQAKKWLYIEAHMYVYECKMPQPMQWIQNLSKLEVSFLWKGRESKGPHEFLAGNRSLGVQSGGNRKPYISYEPKCWDIVCIQNTYWHDIYLKHQNNLNTQGDFQSHNNN